ncbi:MAG: hypothetical protein IPL61_29745 [Myxococcales bacterium]|nr:hypothetical protein [Myxococcales bacterium]
MSRLCIVALVLTAACSKGGGSSSGPGSSAPPAPAIDAAPPPVDAAPPPTDAAEPPIDAGGVAFGDLSKDDQIKFMRTKVMPPMKAAFKKFDAGDFGKFSCKTCHGKGVASKKYEMPNPDLPKLDFAALKAGKHAKMAAFMKDEVTPGMAELLGEPVHSPTNPEGFGCLDCHLEKK